jgi:hypothetical protein
MLHAATRMNRDGKRRFARALAAGILIAAARVALADDLSIDPPNPTSLDTVRLRYAHVGCTNPQSVQVALQAGLIMVQVDRTLSFPDCGTVAGFFEEFTLGRLPAGDYDVSLAVNPPAGTLGPTQLIGPPVHVSVAGLQPSATLHPHDDYSDMWWNPREPGWALGVRQLSEKLFLVWSVYDDAGKPTWLVVPGGAWNRDASNHLRFSGRVYRTKGSPWEVPFDPSTATFSTVGTADFTPLDASHGLFTYTVDGVEGSKMVERFRF